MTKRFIGLIQPPASENLTEVSLSKTCDGDGDGDVPELPSDPLQRRYRVYFDIRYDKITREGEAWCAYSRLNRTKINLNLQSECFPVGGLLILV